MKSSRGRRLGFVLPVALLLAALAPSVQAAPLAPEWSSHTMAATIGTNSCQGVDACRDLTGNVGNNSCNGANACRGVTGNIGDNSCNAADSACRDRSANVGNNSCNETSACRAAPGANIGDGSCNGFEACRDLQVTVGNNSCNGGNAVCRRMTSPIGDCQFNTMTPAACAQPDALIRLGSGSYVGDNIFNLDATDQAVFNSGLVEQKRTFFIKIENNAVGTDSFKVKRSAGFTNGYRVRYYDEANNDVTGKVTVGSFTTPPLGLGGEYVMRVTVKIRTLATPCSFTSRLITVSSVANPDAKDAVRFTVELDASC